MATKVKLIADGVITPDQITLTTASTGTNTTAPATTAFVQQEISALVDSSPEALNTLNELAAALGDDANFSTTVTNSIATKAPLASPTFTGTLTASGLVYPTSDGTNGQVLTTDGAGALSFSTVSGTTINNNADNRIITGSGTANTLEGEANLTFDSTNLIIGTTGAIRVPNGTDEQRPTAALGQIRYSTTSNKLEAYVNGEYVNIDTSPWLPASPSTISGLQVFADVTGGISSTTVADLSGNGRTGTLTNTTDKGTLNGNTYFEAFGTNKIAYAAGVIPDSPFSTGNACSYFFVCTNRKTVTTYGGYIASQYNNNIRHLGNGLSYDFWEQNNNFTGTVSNTSVPVNATINEAYIIVFQFSVSGGQTVINVYKRENGSTTTDSYTASGTSRTFDWTTWNKTVNIGLHLGSEYLNAGIFAWGFTNTAMSSADRDIIYDYYAAKGLAN